MASEMNKHFLLIVLLAVAVVACDRSPPDAEAIAAAPSGHEIESFMECKIPFHPTKRFRALMARGVIPTKPLYVMGGEPRFVPNGAASFYGHRVLLLGAYDQDDPDELYVLPGFGTVPPTFTSVYVVGSKEEVEASVPVGERRWLYIDQDTKFWENNSDYKFPIAPAGLVTEVSCMDSQTEYRDEQSKSVANQ